MTGRREWEPHLPLKSRVMSYKMLSGGTMLMMTILVLFFVVIAHIAVSVKSTPKIYSRLFTAYIFL